MSQEQTFTPQGAIQWYTKVLKNYMLFKGRARRAEFWQFVLVNVVIAIPLYIIGMLLKTNIPTMIYGLAILVPGIAVAWRRMQDLGKPGWYCIIPIYSIYLACLEGDRHENQFGLDPKQAA